MYIVYLVIFFDLTEWSEEVDNEGFKIQMLFSKYMADQLLELRIEDLLMGHREVRKKKVGRYIMKYKNKEYVKPIYVLYCVHTGKHHVYNGHHRMVAKHFFGKSSILAKIEPCYLYHCRGDESGMLCYNIHHVILE